MIRALLVLLVVCCVFKFAAADATDGDSSADVAREVSIPAATTIGEARARASLLHEAMRGTLQVVHRDFFDEDNARVIPSQSLEDVFERMGDNFGVDLKWLIVETDSLNFNHEPEDDFERSAVKALKSGVTRHEAVEDGRYRFAGPIRLASQCLKCHVKHRTSTEDRTAGLLISMPIVAQQK
ncbi:hypothetical protein K227x_32220 [Rubripirellula lacrimiformis]|uniref:Tll0287-like domain-containing protein n=1 Tax=Rubripirellula lacrimiformis TaxID=1930273 RepID=A0A517NCG3_9BACT|nr:DUF3365 domain-containing protein [Rubripirellula lacrimiformis]QDT04825.1 hypothetical protein K227x_32220 [Rubripirellula lacrimiformis]